MVALFCRFREGSESRKEKEEKRGKLSKEKLKLNKHLCHVETQV